MITPSDAAHVEPGSIEAKGVAVSLLGQAQVAEEHGRIADALGQLWHAHALWPELPQIRQKMASLYIRLAQNHAEEKRYSDADIAYLQAIKINPISGQASAAYAMHLYQTAIDFYNQRLYDKAELLIRKALNYRPDFPEASAGLSFITLRRGSILHKDDPTAAEAYFCESLMLRPDFEEAQELYIPTVFNRSITLYNDSRLHEAEITIGELFETGQMREDFSDTVNLVHEQSWKLRLVEPLNDVQAAILDNAARARADTNRNTNQIVMVCENMRVRVHSMAKALTQAGYEVILLFKFDPNFSLDGVCARGIQFQDQWEALHIASTFRPLVYHVLSSSVDSTCLLMHRHKPGPVIYDYQDIFPGMIPGYVVNNVGVVGLWQTEVLHKADGVCCQDLQYRAARKINSWESCRNVLWFPNYGDKYYKPILREDNQIKLISIGTIEDPDLGLTAASAFFGPLLELGVALDIYLHPNRRKWTQERREKFYQPLLSLQTYDGQISLKENVKADELINIIRSYDVGGIPQVLQNTTTDEPFYHDECFNSGLSTRVCEFINSGIVLITPSSFKLSSFIMKRYGYWMDASEASTPRGLEKLRDMVRLSKTSCRMKDSFTIQNNTNRLISFYQRTNASFMNALKTSEKTPD